MSQEKLLPYLRAQTIALFAWWAAVMFLEWAKPGLVSNVVAPNWVLLAAAGSATMTALCLPASASGHEFAHRRIVAVVVALVAGLSVAVSSSPDFGLVVGLVVWGSLISALAPPPR